MPFDGLRVLSLESRRAKEIEQMIVKAGGAAFVAPSVKERAVDDHSVALQFLEQLERGDYDMVICMTAVGLVFLRDTLAAHVPAERLADALRRVTIVSRGPKPITVLRPMGVPIHVAIPEPNTWKEIVEAVAPRTERRIAVQEYGRPNAAMNTALEALGASVTPVALYKWEMPDDLEPLREAVRRVAARECDVVLFTSSIQLDHLLEIAAQKECEPALRQSLAESMAIVSIGPVMTAALEAQGLPPDIVPRHPKMWAIVAAAAEQSAEVLERKRGSKLVHPV
jgi:uroporphyrinogen-III synthase